MKRRVAPLLLAIAATFPLAHAQSGKWPDKPVRVVLPFAPGGAADVVARILSPHLMETFGQQFIVDNRAGAGGTIGAEITARANPDGYTIILTASTYASSAALYKMSFDPVNGIAPVSLVDVAPFVLILHPALKAANVKEFIDLARSKPGAFNFGSSGTGSTLHLSGELFKQLTHIDMAHVPYKGEGPAFADLLAGQIQVMFAAPMILPSHIKAGRIRALAVTTAQRSSLLPELPAIAEQVPGYASGTWRGVWAPLGTPREIIMRLNQALARIIKLPEVSERLRAGGVEPKPTTPEEFGRMIAQEIATWSKVVKVGNIKVD